MGLIVSGVVVDIQGLQCRSWKDDPKMRIGTDDRRARDTSWVRSIFVHTTKGDMPQVVLPGFGPMGMANDTVGYWVSDKGHAGSHLVIDGDATVWCVADLVSEASYHATSVNDVSVGIEICQTSRLEIWQGQIDALVLLCDALTRILGIQRQTQWPYLGEAHPVGRLDQGGGNCVGVFGHRDQTIQRGPGDPGDAPMKALMAAGYEKFNFDVGEDLNVWKGRQKELNVGGANLTVDGIAGHATQKAVMQSGKACGMWVSRPSDLAGSV